MTQNGYVAGGANAPALPIASLFRFYPKWNDRANDPQHRHVPNPIQQRKLDIQKLDKAHFQKLVTFVAAFGFFIDGYLLFANNFALPILGYLYWPNDSTSAHEIGINCATLAGTILGQLILGVLADCKGRKRVYGWELLIVLLGSLAISIASPGLIAPGSPPGHGSMSITALLVVLRFVIGFGVGAEYPITAAITSEWAPAPHRGEMLACVFCAQSLGQCVAAIVAYGALAGGHMQLDAIWRLIYGVAAIPAFFVFFLRRTIPETPRYAYDVQRNYAKASHSVGYMTDGKRTADAVNPEEVDLEDPLNVEPPKQSRRDFMDYFFTPEGRWYSYDGDEIWFFGKWTTFRFTGKWPRLLGTAGTWFLLDLSFFGLGLNSPQIVTGLWKGCRSGNVSNPLPTFTWNSEPDIANSAVPLFEDNEYGFWLMVSIGAITGSVVLILLARFVDRRRLLWTTFLALGILFFVIGGILWHEIMDHYSPSYFAVIVFYAICQFLFNLGPNALTFMIPAEIFPTRYRCTCHGISAACGKLGSVVAQVSLLNIQFNALRNCKHSADINLGKVLIGFGFVMLLGAFVAWSLLPRVQYGNDNKNEMLEELGKGPPPRPTSTADPEQGQQGGQQQKDGSAPQDVLQGGIQSQQGLRPGLVGGHQQVQEQNGERAEPSDEDSPPPPPPPRNDDRTPVRTPQLRSRRRPIQAHSRQQSPEQHEMEQYHQPESSSARLNRRGDNQQYL